MKAPLSTATAQAVREALSARFGVMFGTKGGVAWAAAALAFDIARMFGAQVPSGSRFVGDYITTIALTVFYPAGKTYTAQEQIEIDTHETRHAHQFVAEPGVMPFEYLRNSRRRAEYESAAFGDGLAIRWAITGEIPPTVDALPHGALLEYACTTADLQMAQDQLEQLATSIARGVIPEGPARTVIATIARVQPDALDPRALELIRAHSPGVIQ